MHGDITGRFCYDVKGRVEPCLICPIVPILREGKTFFRYESQHKSGKWFDVISAPLKNPDGTVDVIEMLRDITERNQTEEMLQRQLNELRRVGEMIEKLSRNLTLRTVAFLWLISVFLKSSQRM